MKIRIGMGGGERDLEIEIEDPDAFTSALEASLAGGTPMVWVTALDGHRYGLVAKRVTYLEVEPVRARAVGFGGSTSAQSGK